MRDGRAVSHEGGIQFGETEAIIPTGKALGSQFPGLDVTAHCRDRNPEVGAGCNDIDPGLVGRPGQ